MLTPNKLFAQPNVEKKENIEYNFKEMKEFEKPMISMVSKMKHEIENGEYSVILSDDIGGRIPSLVLRQIIKEKSSNKDIHTFFVSAGHSTPGRNAFLSWDDHFYYDSDIDYDEESIQIEEEKRFKNLSLEEKLDVEVLKHYLEKNIGDNDKVLVSSQYSHYGKSLKALCKYLQQEGIENFDISSVSMIEPEDLEKTFPNSSIFYGGKSGPEDVIWESGKGIMQDNEEKYREISGVKKNNTEGFNPVPGKIEGVDENHKKAIQQVVNEGREDIKILAKKIIKEVWS